jgi:GntR family transcriptional repressor for pyruvate dehydrogenase complex
VTIKPLLHVFTPEKRESTASRVERQIKRAVLEGHFSAGEFLGSENDLANRFGVSRLPIREAMGRLNALGVVSVRTGAGGGVRIGEGNPSPAIEALAIQLSLMNIGANEVLDALRCLERSVLKLAAKRATEVELSAIEAAIDHAETLAATADEAFTEAALACHQAEVDAARNHVLSVTMAAIFYALFPTVNRNTTKARTKSVIEYHRKMLAALRERDGDRAIALFDGFIGAVSVAYFGDPAERAGSVTGAGPQP